jgi:hypothetical protein
MSLHVIAPKLALGELRHQFTPAHVERAAATAADAYELIAIDVFVEADRLPFAAALATDMPTAAIGLRIPGWYLGEPVRPPANDETPAFAGAS